MVISASPNTLEEDSASSSATGHPVEVLTAVAAAYFLFAFPLTRAVSMIEARVLRRIAA